jgi:hypothetical protein
MKRPPIYRERRAHHVVPKGGCVFGGYGAIAR